MQLTHPTFQIAICMALVFVMNHPSEAQSYSREAWVGHRQHETGTREWNSFDSLSTLAAPPSSTMSLNARNFASDSINISGCNSPTNDCSQLYTDPFGDFISPISNPIYFEDPRNLTESRILFMQQKIPLAAGCGDVQVYAGQLRATLTDNLSLVINKAGYVSGTNAFTGDGWLDFSAGLKMNLIQDRLAGQLLSTGFTFEAPTGEASAFQGNGDGELHLFVSGAKRLSRSSHWISGLGARVPMNSTDESQSLYWSNHIDFCVKPRLYLLAEINWFHWLNAGEDGCLCYEGLDLFNFGTPGVEGNDIVTAAFGTKFKTSCDSEFGFAFEFPLTERRDILDNRIIVEWIKRL